MSEYNSLISRIEVLERCVKELNHFIDLQVNVNEDLIRHVKHQDLLIAKLKYEIAGNTKK
jgi:hypothetical protein